MNINDCFRDLNVGLPEDILRRKLHGDFEGAIRLIDRRLAREDQPQGLRNCLTVQREMMVRIPDDYPYSREEALAMGMIPASRARTVSLDVGDGE